MTPRADDWLAGILQRPVFRIAGAFETAPSAGALDALADHVGKQRAAMYYAKVPTTAIDTVRALGRLGFYVVDVNLTFTIGSPGQWSPSIRVPVGITVDDIRPEQHDDVLRIAGSCFRYDRFHLDPMIPDATADRIKREWIANYIRKARGERLLAAAVDGTSVGFLAVLDGSANGTTSRVIDLVGVSRDVQRRGVGAALVHRFVELYRETCDELRVGTQAANVGSSVLYERAGFTLGRSEYVLHRHSPGPQTG